MKGYLRELKQKDITSKEFFSIICKNFCEKWPVVPVTEPKKFKVGLANLATKTKQERYNKVHLLF